MEGVHPGDISMMTASVRIPFDPPVAAQIFVTTLAVSRG